MSKRSSELEVSQPFPWDLMRDYFSFRAIPGVERVQRGLYERTIEIEGVPGRLALGRSSASALALGIEGALSDALPGLIPRARRIFNLDADVDEAESHLGRDPIIGPLVKARPGLRPAGTWSGFETGVRAILGQQVSVRGATTIAGRLVERCGAALGTNDGLDRLFPTPERLADCDLSELGVPGSRACALSAFSSAVAEGRLVLDGAERFDALVASIVALPGLGPWTAHYIALRLGYADAFPGTDLGVKKAVAALGNGASIATISEGWRPWRAFATTHLWAASPV